MGKFQNGLHLEASAKSHLSFSELELTENK